MQTTKHPTNAPPVAKTYLDYLTILESKSHPQALAETYLLANHFFTQHSVEAQKLRMHFSAKAFELTYQQEEAPPLWMRASKLYMETLFRMKDLTTYKEPPTKKPFSKRRYLKLLQHIKRCGNSYQQAEIYLFGARIFGKHSLYNLNKKRTFASRAFELTYQKEPLEPTWKRAYRSYMEALWQLHSLQRV